jgi:phage gp46-like protein
MSDVDLILEENGGDLILSGGDVLIGNGLTSAAILSLFGGNFEDSNLPGTDSLQFWGNRIGEDPNESLRSETQKLLESIPATSENLLRVQDAVVRDLSWLIGGIVSELSVQIALVAVKRVSITIDLTVNGEDQQIQFTREWTGAR